MRMEKDESVSLDFKVDELPKLTGGMVCRYAKDKKGRVYHVFVIRENWGFYLNIDGSLGDRSNPIAMIDEIDIIWRLPSLGCIRSIMSSLRDQYVIYRR
jgi:hypothetical protein